MGVKAVSRLASNSDPAACPSEFTLGRDGKPFYFQGPNDSYAQAKAISQRVAAAGGHFVVQVSAAEAERLAGVGGVFDEPEALEDDSPDEIAPNRAGPARTA
jgi:hypothetical protein